MPSIPPTNATRSTWLRRFSSLNPRGKGNTHSHFLYEIANAAARETLVTSAHHMCAIWTALFQGMLCPGSELRWLEDGPGIGRDARTAYSSLLGRYLARAYLCSSEGVLVLVPLDVAKRSFRGTAYSIHKRPAGSRGLQADWIGLDTQGHLIIAEAKGSHDLGQKPWRGPSQPSLLGTAEGQASRTVVRKHRGHLLPARRWAVLSRWGTAQNQREPTLLASCDDGGPLRGTDFYAIARALLDSDRRTVLTNLGHPDTATALPSDDKPHERIPNDTTLCVRDIEFPPGFAALAGPFGFRRLRGPDDISSAQNLLETSTPRVAVASFSSRHATTLHPDRIEFERKFIEPGPSRVGANAEVAGLSVAWPVEPTDVQFRDA